MPELPEVEGYRRFFDKTSLNKRIQKISLSTRNMLMGTTDRELKNTLEGNSFTSTDRHGKFMFAKLKSGEALMLHFGMTGDLLYDEEAVDVKSFAIRFQFKDGSELVFSDPRRLGKIALVDDVAEFIAKRKYGKDALKISSSEFIDKLKNKRTAIKVSLMDQKTLAGVGNEYSDEILFRSRIHPASITAKLSVKQLQSIFRSMGNVLKEAVKNRAERSKLTQFFFLGNRRAGLICPRCNGETQWKEIGGRSSYFCPSCQKLYR